MRASIERAKSRGRSSITDRAVTARQQGQPIISLKGGNLFLREPDMTDPVSPGGSVQTDATVSNGANFIFNDADRCERPENPCDPGINILADGYCYELSVSPEWAGTDNTGPGCVNVTEVGTGDQNHGFQFPAPTQTGDFNVQFTLEALGTGERDTAIRKITVSDQNTGPGGCSTNADCPSGQVCENGTCVSSDDDFPLELVIGLFVVIVIGAVVVNQVQG